MMQRKIFLILALLCAVAQGAWAQWDGGDHTAEGDNIDGIGSIKSLTLSLSEGEGAWYDLSGRKMVNGKWSNRKLPKGIYIHNGRKEVLK